MRAALTRAIGTPFEIADIDISEPIGHEVIVRVRASGLCHSDLSVSQRGFGVSTPIVLGHEISGVVERIGPSVTQVDVGDHVVACLVRWCGRCLNCRAGRPFACTDPTFIERTSGQESRLSEHGETIEQFWGLSGFAEEALIHENQLVRIPDNVPFDVACLLGCGVVTGAGAVINTAQTRVGETVAVFGCGGVGLNAIQAARLAGAVTIIAVDLHEDKLELAKRFGATHVVNAALTDPVTAIRSLTSGLGVDKAFEIVGLHQTVLQALASLAVGGGLYLVGIHQPGHSISLDLDTDLMARQNTITGVHMGSAFPRRDIPRYADLYLQGRWNLDDLVSRRIDIAEINEAYEELMTGLAARSVITFAN